MKLKVFLLVISGALSIIACSENDDRVNQGETLEGVRTENISDIIRMPVSASDSTDTSALAKFFFDETTFNFDTIYEGDIVEHNFRFKNTGKTSLLINDVRSPCGCTVPTWPKEAIPPGEEGEIFVKFNSQGKPGRQTKGVTLFANTYPNKTMLRVYGIVIPKKNNN